MPCQNVVLFTEERSFNHCYSYWMIGRSHLKFELLVLNHLQGVYVHKKKENLAKSQTSVLLLELQLRESTLNWQDRCCLSVIMVVFQCAADRGLHGSFFKHPANICCQAPLVLLITHGKVMVKWDQLAWPETVWTKGEWWIAVGYWSLPFPYMGLCSRANIAKSTFQSLSWTLSRCI